MKFIESFGVYFSELDTSWEHESDIFDGIYHRIKQQCYADKCICMSLLCRGVVMLFDIGGPKLPKSFQALFVSNIGGAQTLLLLYSEPNIGGARAPPAYSKTTPLLNISTLWEVSRSVIDEGAYQICKVSENANKLLERYPGIRLAFGYPLGLLQIACKKRGRSIFVLCTLMQ